MGAFRSSKGEHQKALRGSIKKHPGEASKSIKGERQGATRGRRAAAQPAWHRVDVCVC